MLYTLFVFLVGLPHSVSVRVNNRGHAAVKIENSLNASFTLLPTVESVSPHTGSMMGGSILTISGNGFSPNPDVKIGGAQCQILSSSYTQIKCQTIASSTSQSLPVVVGVHGVESYCASSCMFTYSAAETPRVDSLTPSAIVGDDNTIRIYGSGLPRKMSDLDIKIGDTSCSITSSSEYSASCRVGSVVAGTHDVKIHVAGQGFAMFEAGASPVIKGLAILSSITPTEGSIMGGTELSIKGSGFDPVPGRTTVKIGANFCSIVRVTSSEVKCRTSAHGPGSFEVCQYYIKYRRKTQFSLGRSHWVIIPGRWYILENFTSVQLSECPIVTFMYCVRCISVLQIFFSVHLFFYVETNKQGE